jgi:predicted transcriptional regulator of viral defense system
MVDRLEDDTIDTKYNQSYSLCWDYRSVGNLSNAHHDQPQRTVGSQTARLLTALYDRSQSTFTLAEAAKITGLSPHLTSSLLHKAARRGLVYRLKPGLFTIVPVELGSSVEHTGNPYMVAQRLAGEAPCFISHASAMEIHRMVTQPPLVVFASSTKRIPVRTLHGTAFRFVFIKPEHFFGTANHWVTKQETVHVSDLERTVIDGLRQPEYCGGVTDVAKGLWMRHQDMQATKLVDYARRLGIGAVIRRLGYLLELYRVVPENDLVALRKSLTETYVPLDPMLPREGPYLKRWRLQLNVSPEELEAVRGT